MFPVFQYARPACAQHWHAGHPGLDQAGEAADDAGRGFLWWRRYRRARSRLLAAAAEESYGVTSRQRHEELCEQARREAGDQTGST